MKYKKHIILLLVISLVFYCRHKVLNHNIPIANIEFVKIEKNDEYENSFFLYFSSDIELIENLKKEHTGGLTIKCFFLDKIINENDFSDYKSYYLQSRWNKSELINKTSKEYIYKVNAVFRDNIDSKKEKIIKGINEFINENNTNCLSCVATSVAYMNIPKRYISNTMCISKKELKKVMKKE